MRFRPVLATAGHVDHGKTTLVRALTGVDTDRLPEEKRRGITIELGFARVDLGDGAEASLVDVPGHRRLVHTMIAGASGVGGVLLVVAADEGVMPQTREHLAVCELLGVRRAVVALTKCDRVDDDLVTIASDEVSALVRGRFIGDGEANEPRVVRCAPARGEGVAEVIEALASLAAAVGRDAATATATATHGPRARLAVDRVFHAKGTGPVVTGTLVEGVLRVGDAVRVVGPTRELAAHVRGLQIHGAARDAAHAPCRLAVALAGPALADLARGDVVTTDAALAPTARLDAALTRASTAIRRGAELTLHAGTTRAAARVERLDDGFARLRLAQPVVLAGGDRFVLRASRAVGDEGAVAGGGVALDVAPPARVRSRVTVLSALAAGDAPRAFRALLAEASPRPLARAELSARLAVSGDAIAEAAAARAKDGDVVRLPAARSDAWVARADLEELASSAARLVAKHADDAPIDRGLPLATLRGSLARRAGDDAADAAIELARGRGAIDVHGDVATPPPSVARGDAVRVLVDGAARALEEAGVHGVSEFGVRTATGASPSDTRALLAHLRRQGRATQLGELWFAAAVLDRAREQAMAHLRGRGRMTVVEFKAVSSMPRNQAILFLEHLDRLGVTRRDGDARVLVE